MKTITLDYDLYMKELAKARENGEAMGLFRAQEYIKDPRSSMMPREKYYASCNLIDAAIKYRIEKEVEEKND